MKAVRSERTGDRDLRFPLRSVWKVIRSGIGPAWKAVGACKGMGFNSLSFRYTRLRRVAVEPLRRCGRN